MSGKTNPELAREYISYVKRVGFDIFKEWRPQEGGGSRKCLFILRTGEAGAETNFAELCRSVSHWLQARRLDKSEEQVRHIAEGVGRLVEARGGRTPG